MPNMMLDERRDSVVRMRVSASERERIRKTAEEKRLTMSALLRLAFEAYQQEARAPR